MGGVCVRSLAPAEAHSQPASSSTDGRPTSSPARVRPAQRNLIYYPRFCLRLDSVDAIDSRLMNCIRGVDYFRTLLVYSWRAFAHLKAEMGEEEGKKPPDRRWWRGFKAAALTLNRTIRAFTRQQCVIPGLVKCWIIFKFWGWGGSVSGLNATAWRGGR